MIDKKAIEVYLELVRRTLSSDGLLIFSSREKNLAFLERQGFTISEIRECISSLSASNYCSGPMYDSSGENRNDVWIFGTRVNDVEVYIKISFGDTLNKVICISFHEAEHVMLYPYGGENDKN